MDITDPLTRRIHIKMSGCPNGCSQHHIGNIGFYGASIKVGEHTIPAYVAHIGGNYEGGDIVYGTRLKVRLAAKRVPGGRRALDPLLRGRARGRRGLQRLRRARRDQGLRGPRPRPLPADRVRPGDDGDFIDWTKNVPFQVDARRGRMRGLSARTSSSSRRRPSTSSARSRPSSRSPSCSSAAARTRSSCSRWPRRRSRRRRCRSRSCTWTRATTSRRRSSSATAACRTRSWPRVQESIDKGRVVEETGPRASRNRLQTTTLLDAIAEHGFDAAFGGARRDEERARAKERVFSFRDDFGQWDPRKQRPGAVGPLQRPRPPRRARARVPALQLDRARRLGVHPRRGARDPGPLRRPRARGVRARRDALRGLATSSSAWTARSRSPSGCATARSAT